ncbi:MAG: sulfite exporter TauE/SafE family protein [Halobacteria archaeon]
MVLGFPEWIVLLLATVSFLGGSLKGLIGWGSSITATSVMAVVINPSTAVILMIIPVFVGNISLIASLDITHIKEAFGRFWIYFVTAGIGAAAGTFYQKQVPEHQLVLVLGLLVLLYVALKQQRFEVPWPETSGSGFFNEGSASQGFMGIASGAILGSTNTGITTIVYLDSQDLRDGVYFGMIGLFFFSISGVRILTAYRYGMYGSGNLFWLSLGAAGSLTVGFYAGVRIRRYLPENYINITVLIALTAVGLKLIQIGLTAP